MKMEWLVVINFPNPSLSARILPFKLSNDRQVINTESKLSRHCELHHNVALFWPNDQILSSISPISVLRNNG